jgi:hypothetical protein
MIYIYIYIYIYTYILRNVQLFRIEYEILWLILDHCFQYLPQNETPRHIRNPTQCKYLTVSSNRTFQNIAVYLPALAVRRLPIRCTGKIWTILDDL